MCTKTRRITKGNPAASRTDNNSDATGSSSSRSPLNSFLHSLILEKIGESEGGPLYVKILPDDAHGSKGGLLRKECSRIGRSNSDPLPLSAKRSALDVSDHTKRVSRWLSTQPASSDSKQILSNCMVRQPMRIPSVRRINAACSA
mmetsp:Transcript_11769/g.28229  ORF Transcript_11769/g.28229 Transcript_11769/m.28229 type:complete len:145 (+) Transcript_11769:147-581(+)|eukprot:CAMPEP_0113622358 /NCGR_PEP_ID=MMETSP0017_2-20120614/11453_1 /TAXON_ID=2856 /ORGANISM="Cylindrotheca closterium" /LENGTH=144 /DNA_ID=CAMNT_0000532179 /DNA_START=99 /DNA_END=533 /DNA_ORIENTATION=- /assembly_acc=CAM_ASM_000147